MPESARNVQSSQPMVRRFFHQVTYGATGAISSQSSGSGITHARTAAGRYTATFDPVPNGMLGAGMLADSQGTATGTQLEIFTPYSNSDGTFVFSTVVATSETDPTSGNVHWYWYDMQMTDAGVSL